jgi:plasmid stabilization system protein ParE
MPGIRVRIIGRYRYKIFYALAGDGAVEIIHIRHAARRPWGAVED